MKVLYDELHEFDNAVSDFEIILREFLFERKDFMV